MSEPLVDVIIPVHRVDRDLGGALASCRASAQGVASRAIVVLHNLAGSTPPELDRDPPLPTLVLRCDDGVASPSGPRNVGLESVRAPYVFFLDSDDALAPGCLGRLHRALDALHADVALPSIQIGDRFIGTPLDRGRARVLDACRDDLFTRAHVPAMVRRDVVERAGLRFPQGVRTGEDLVVLARLFVGSRVVHVPEARYLVSTSAPDRASVSALPDGEVLGGVRALLDAPWVQSLDDDVSQSLHWRLLSVSTAGGWRRRRGAGQAVHPREFIDVRDRIAARRPDVVKLLSLRDRVAIRFSVHPAWWERMLLLPVFGVVPVSLRGLLSRRGPVVAELRSWRVRRRAARAARGQADSSSAAR